MKNLAEQYVHYHNSLGEINRRAAGEAAAFAEESERAYRAELMRIAEKVAQRVGAGAIVTGESLGQVASQTLDAMRATTAVTTLPILRPVVGMDKEEIIRVARRIGTFDTSILPYEDCCTVFTPRHPRLHPLPGELEAAEAALDVDGLVQAAVEGIERVRV